MKKYIIADNYGKGFITHQDQFVEGLSFEVIDNIVAVEGDEENINKWSDKVNGVDIIETEALIQLKTIKVRNLNSVIAEKEAELVILKEELINIK